MRTVIVPLAVNQIENVQPVNCRQVGLTNLKRRESPTKAVVSAVPNRTCGAVVVTNQPTQTHLMQIEESVSAKN